MPDTDDPLLAEDRFTGLTAGEIFELGYECADVDSQILNGKAFTRHVRAENRPRIARTCRELGRKFSFCWLSNDAAEAWMELRVEGK